MDPHPIPSTARVPLVPALVVCCLVLCIDKKGPLSPRINFIHITQPNLYIMSSITGALVRRGTEAAFGTFQEKKPDQPNGGLVALFAMTVLVLGLAFWSVSTPIMSSGEIN